mgnify:CR=1 FL=1
MSMPELRRNLWLEFTPHRLIVTPVVLAALFYLAYLSGGILSVQSMSFYVFIFFTYLWGIRSASEALCDEINQKTWDWQSALLCHPPPLDLDPFSIREWISRSPRS